MKAPKASTVATYLARSRVLADVLQKLGRVVVELLVLGNDVLGDVAAANKVQAQTGDTVNIGRANTIPFSLPPPNCARAFLYQYRSLIMRATCRLSSGGIFSPRSRINFWIKSVISRPASGMCLMQLPMT